MGDFDRWILPVQRFSWRNCWGTYAYMHICTKSIQIYFGIFFDFILVILSFHCSHTVPIFSEFFRIFPYFSCHFIHFKSLSFWHSTVNFCFRLSARVPARRAESNCIICNARAHLGMLSGVEAGGGNRVYAGWDTHSHFPSSVLTVTEEVRTHCFFSFIVLINCIIVSVRYYQYISVLTITEEFLLAKSSKFLIPTVPISTL